MEPPSLGYHNDGLGWVGLGQVESGSYNFLLAGFWVSSFCETYFFKLIENG